MDRHKLKLLIAFLAFYFFGLFSGILLDRILGVHAPSGKIRVVVLGEVEKPGAYRLSKGAFLKDLVQAAGGFTVYANLSAVDLSLPLEDGMTVTIPPRNFPGKGNVTSGGPQADELPVSGSLADSEPFHKEEPSGSKPEPSPPGKLVNINTATAAELETLPGIGPKLAQEIIKYRETYGPFKKKEDLKKVKGIGDAKFAALADRITI